jgi:F-type H+-transporting ATPase subunit delta
MAKVDDKQIGVARIYCRSALELAEEAGPGVADRVKDELDELAKLMQSDAGFADFITSPLIDPEARAASLDKLFRNQLSDVLLDTLQVMNQKGRLEVLPTFVELYKQEHQSLRGKVDVYVTTSVPLKFKLRAKLKETLSKFLGKDPELIEEVDPAMIAGLIVRVDDLKYDASVRRQVAVLRAMLHDRASREIHLSHNAIDEK